MVRKGQTLGWTNERKRSALRKEAMSEKIRLVEIDGDVTIDASAKSSLLDPLVVVWSIGAERVETRHLDRAICKIGLDTKEVNFMRIEDEPTIDQLKEVRLEQRGNAIVRVGVFPREVRKVLDSTKIGALDQIETGRDFPSIIEEMDWQNHVDGQRHSD